MVNELPELTAQNDGGALINRRLRSLDDAMPEVRTLSVVNDKGMAIASDRPMLIGMDVHEREYFDVARRASDPAVLYVSRPFKTVLGFLSINLVRVTSDAHGGYAGIVMATLDPEYFRTLRSSAAELYQIVMNLCVNAVDAVGNRHGTISIALARRDA